MGMTKAQRRRYKAALADVRKRMREGKVIADSRREPTFEEVQREILGRESDQ